ncbi:MAG: glycosyl transferase family 2 [Provencibacterium sp.]|nr:glycosyl transferase family 2 [Provencibacterium sp.]
MGKYHICVYAICKNEEKFVDRWMDSMSEADSIVVLDTGSEDKTVERLRSRGAQVWQEAIVPWRFDRARNRSLELVPPESDICVCTDLDEVFHLGWRARLEAAWKNGTKRARYRYTWSFLPDGNEGVVFWLDKIHANRQFRWIHPVHEVLQYLEEGGYETVSVPGMQLDHHPDAEKSRGQYLPMLEMAVKECPEDDRNRHYLGREYMFRGRWDDCIKTLKWHLSMPQATWADERSASMRYIACAYEAKGEAEQAKSWLYRAMGETPHLREPYMEMAALLYRQQEWEGVLFMVLSALKITERPLSYISEPEAWGTAPYDYGAIACYWLGNYHRALQMVEEALRLSPDNERLQDNRRRILAAMPPFEKHPAI